MEKISFLLAPKQVNIALVFLSSVYEEKEIIPRINVVPTKAITRNNSIPKVAALIKLNNASDIVKEGDSIFKGD